MVVEKINPPSAAASPECPAGERACPPEDFDGMPGYEAFLEAIRMNRKLRRLK